MRRCWANFWDSQEIEFPFPLYCPAMCATGSPVPINLPNPGSPVAVFENLNVVCARVLSDELLISPAIQTWW